MIQDIVSGDITAPENPADIIIGMNSQLSDVTGIGRPFVNKLQTQHPIQLGCVLSFEFDDNRRLHMIICHHLGQGGWVGSDMHVRFGLDYLWQKPAHILRKFSIVMIGSGRVGLRDGANPAAILTAMTNSHLPVTLFLFDRKLQQDGVVALQKPPLRPLSVWHPNYGEEVPVAA
jgi:hypothetical protein